MSRRTRGDRKKMREQWELNTVRYTSDPVDPDEDTTQTQLELF